MDYSNRITPDYIDHLREGQIFVYGSNVLGRHGAGAARCAIKFGATMGNGIGIQGSTYAIPTKDHNIKTMPISEIKPYVDDFVEWAKYHKGNTFLVTPIGTGLAGIPFEEIAPLFKEALHIENIHLPKRFFEILLKK